MKTLILNITIILLFLNTYSQTTIKTPTNVSIEAYIHQEADPWLATWEAQAAAWISDHNSKAIRVAPASYTYNCHNFAFHQSDGGSIRWVDQLNQYGQVNLAKYWTGSSPTYQQTVASKATKAFYSNDDHSAIVISPGLFESKWGRWPRYRHAPLDCLYSGPIVYFHIPLNGDDLVCNAKSYSTLNISGASYSWSGNKVSVSGSGSTVNATKTSDGTGWIKVNISSPHSGTTVTGSKDVWAGPPSYDYISGPMYTPNNQWAFYTAEPNNLLMGAYYSHTWILNPLNGNALYPAGRSVDIAFYNSGDYQLIVQGQNACGVGPNRVTGIHVYDTRSLSITPNPATNEATVTIKSSSVEKTLDEAIEWDLEVYNSQQMLVKKMTRIRDNQYRLQTTGWRTGSYIVRVIYGNEILNQKLLIVGD